MTAPQSQPPVKPMDRSPRFVRELEAAREIGFTPRSPSPEIRRLIVRGWLRRARYTMAGEPHWLRADFADECDRLRREHAAWLATFAPGSSDAGAGE